eukprot:TRINITY_DN28230_c0_g1_i1.p1 TRINITY_DN28230_c0_g1~~TRINITY_DN28230_c0_g1_i1.p1  ORF type:complete len:455 (+),score=82.19 TRINITY_DN28230_c0_g1_i1:48-1367(+)
MASRRGACHWVPTFDPCNVAGSARFETSKGVVTGSPSPQRRHLTVHSGFNIDPTRDTAAAQASPRGGKRCNSPGESPRAAAWTAVQSHRNHYSVNPTSDTTLPIERRLKRNPAPRTRPTPHNCPFGTEMTPLAPGERDRIFSAAGTGSLRSLSPAASPRDADRSVRAFVRSHSAPDLLSFNPRHPTVAGGLPSPANRSRSPHFSPSRHPTAAQRNVMTGTGVPQPPPERRLRRTCSASPTAIVFSPSDTPPASPGTGRRVIPQPCIGSPGAAMASGVLHSLQRDDSRTPRRTANCVAQRAGSGRMEGAGCGVTTRNPEPRGKRRSAKPAEESPFAADTAGGRSRMEDRQSPIGKSRTWLSRVKHQKRKDKPPPGEVTGGAAPAATDAPRPRPIRRPGRISVSATRPSPPDFLYGGVGDTTPMRDRRHVSPQRYRRSFAW